MSIYPNYKFTKKDMQWRDVSSGKIRKILLNKQTVAEKILHQRLLILLKGECKIICQKVIYTPKSFYIADFFLNRYRLVIEVDGGYHNTEQQKKLDDVKEKHFLIRKNYRFIRFTNEEIMINIDSVLNRIACFKIANTQNWDKEHKPIFIPKIKIGKR